MLRFVVRRGVGAAVTFLASTLVVFVITFAIPGDPARAIAGYRRVPESTLRAIRAAYRLEDPLPVQYLRWLGRLVKGDLGESYVARRAVRDMLFDAMPVTLTLMAVTVAIEVVGALAVGSAVAQRRGRGADHAVLVASTLALATPLFVVGGLVQDWFGVRLGWLPISGTGDGLLSYVLPAFTLALPGLAIAIRVVRAEAITLLDAPHTRTARGKGLSERQVMRRHVVRNASVPFVSFIGLEVGALIGGAVIVERVFNLPGIGRQIARAISQRDNSVIIGLTMVAIAAYLVLDVVTDLISFMLDRRQVVAS